MASVRLRLVGVSTGESMRLTGNRPCRREHQTSSRPTGDFETTGGDAMAAGCGQCVIGTGHHGEMPMRTAKEQSALVLAGVRWREHRTIPMPQWGTSREPPAATTTMHRRGGQSSDEGAYRLVATREQTYSSPWPTVRSLSDDTSRRRHSQLTTLNHDITARARRGEPHRQLDDAGRTANDAARRGAPGGHAATSRRARRAMPRAPRRQVAHDRDTACRCATADDAVSFPVPPAMAGGAALRGATSAKRRHAK
jgi:hypothetical protein